jgi:hypothetical protein
MYKKYCIHRVFPLFILWLVMTPAWALEVCLEKKGVDFNVCDSRICIDTIIEGTLKEERKPYLYTVPVVKPDLAKYTNIAPNDDMAAVLSNTNDYYLITPGLAKSNNPIWATAGSVTLRTGTEVEFSDCQITKGLDKLIDEVKDYDWLTGSNVTYTGQTIPIPDPKYSGNYDVYKEKWSPKTYSCTEQKAEGLPWEFKGARTLVDGLALEFRCNIVTIMDTIGKYARRIFVALFWIDTFWTNTALVIGGGRDLQNFLKVLIRKLFFYGFFWWLLNLTAPGTNFFEDGSWVGQTIYSMEKIGIDMIQGDGTEAPIFKTIQLSPSAGVSDMQKYVDDGSLFIHVNPLSAGQISKNPSDPIVGISPARIMLFGFNLMGAILSAFGQTVLINLPGIVAGAVLAAVVDPELLAMVIKVFLIFLFIAFCVSIMALITMITLGGQIFIAMLEMYLICGLGFLFLGFGGSRWTVDTVAKYMGYVLVTGIKILMMIVIMIVTIFMIDGWVHRMLDLAGGGISGGKNAAFSFLSSLDPVQMIMRIFECILVYLSISIEALVLFTVAMRAPDFLLGMIGGSPLLSGGQLTQVSLAGLQAASQISTAGIRGIANLAQTAGNIAGNPLAILNSAANTMRDEFNMGAGIHHAPAAEEIINGLEAPAAGAGGISHGTVPPAHAGATGAAANARDAEGPGGEGRIARFLGSERTWSQKTGGQKLFTGTVGGLGGLGGVIGVGGALAAGAAAPAAVGGLAFGAYKGLKVLSKPHHAANKKIGASLVAKTKLGAWAREKGKKYREKNPDTDTGDAENSIKHTVEGTAQQGNSNREREGAAHRTPREIEEAKHERNKHIRKVIKNAILAYVTFGGYQAAKKLGITGAVKGTATGLKKLNQNKTGLVDADINPKAETKLGAARNKLSSLLSQPRTIVAAGAIGAISGIRHLSPISAKDAASRTLTSFPNKTNRREGLLHKLAHAGIQKSWEKKRKKMKQDYNDYKDDHTFGNEVSTKIHPVGDVTKQRNIGRPKEDEKQMVEINFKDKDGVMKTMRARKSTFGGHDTLEEVGADGKKTGRIYTISGEGRHKKINALTIEESGPKAYQTLGSFIKDAHKRRSTKTAIGISRGTEIGVGIGMGALAGGQLLTDTLKSIGNYGRNITSEKGGIGSINKGIGKLVASVGSNPIISNTRGYEGTKWPVSVSWAGDDDD